jgi:hypothetical protein
LIAQGMGREAASNKAYSEIKAIKQSWPKPGAAK